MLLKSAIVKAESPLYVYFHRLLQPGVHYAPFMTRHQDDILDVVRGLQLNDTSSQAMGEAAYAFAEK